MKRLMFYSLIVIQIIVVAALVFEFERISATGEEIQVLVEKEYSSELDKWEYTGRAYLQYDINEIPESKWDSEKEEVSYNDKVYVLLKKSADNIFEVEKASIKKLEASGDDEVVVIGRSEYDAYSNEPVRVNYRFNTIEHIEQFGQFDSNQALKVTLYVSKYGQYKITDVEVVE